MKFYVLSIFPEIFQGVFDHSIPRIAQEKGSLKVECIDFRDYAQDKHRKVDDEPYGGGPGMLLKPEPIFLAVDNLLARCDPKPRKIILTPQGKTLNQDWVIDLAREKEIILLCGRYEGFDQRIVDGLGFEEMSVGDYVLSGGEFAAMMLIDTVTRLLPGVLGDAESPLRESFGEGLLDFPQYTRPLEFRGMKVPDILLGGHHAEIEKWRKAQALEKTRRARPDLFDIYMKKSNKQS